MDNYFNKFISVDQSIEQVLIDEHNSLEIKQSATRLKQSVQPCIEELRQSAIRLKRIVLVCCDELYQSENVWLSKPRIAEAAKQEIWEKLGEISGRSFKIRLLGSQCKREASEQIIGFWSKQIKYLESKWFIDQRGQRKKGIGWDEKDGFIIEMKSKFNYQILEINKIIKASLDLVYNELISIELDRIKYCISLLDERREIELSKHIDSRVTELKSKFSNPIESLPNHLLKLETALSPDLKALVENGWGDIYWKDVDNFKAKVSLKIDNYITAIFDDRVKLATQSIEEAIAFYNDFLERQERYQQETPEQRAEEKAWIDQQRQELEQVHNSIEVILNPFAP